MLPGLSARSAGALLALMLMLTLGTRSAGALTEGIDCGCSETGPYVLPASPEDIDAANRSTGMSPGNRYLVSATITGGPLVSVTRVSGSALLVSNVPATAWGFSPDIDRFVVYYLEGGVPHGALYNLDTVGTAPLTPIFRTELRTSGRIAFSPHGHYALAMTIPSTGPDHFALEVVDARTGQRVHSDDIVFASPNSLPPGQTRLGAVRVGFGPDSSDRSLVYAWIAGNGLLQKSYQFLKLDESPPQRWFRAHNHPFDWGFSPCGDLFSEVVEAQLTPKSLVNQASLFSTLDMARQGYLEFPGTDDWSLTAGTSHVVRYGQSSTPQTLATNEADNACPVTPPIFPLAAFSIGAQRMQYLPVTFTNQSSTPSGTLAAHNWSFGDGNNSQDANPTHAFLASGTFNVRLTVTNSFGRADTVEHPVTIVANAPPVASFTYSPTNPNSRDIVTFTSTSTDDDDIYDVYWAINGESFQGPVVTAKVCAPEASVYLAVRDSAFQQTTLEATIAVGGTSRVEVPPGADLQAAADGACAGDTLVLQTGTYAGGVTLHNAHLEGAGQGLSIIDGADQDGWSLVLDFGSYALDGVPLSISKLTVSGGQLVEHPYYREDTGGGIYLAGGGDAVLDDVEASYNGGIAGLYRYNDNGRATVRSSRFHHNEGAGVAFNVAGATISDTELAFNGVGAEFSETGVNLERLDVHDNARSGLNLNANGYLWSSRVYGNGAGAYAVSMGGGSMEVADCLIAMNHGGGVRMDRGSRLVQSTVASNCETGISAYGGELHNTIVFGNGLDWYGTVTEDLGNLVSEDPHFVGAGDFHLTSSSPAIDQADPALTPPLLTEDADGDNRILDGGSGTALPDIGWDEWRDGQPSSSVPVLACAPSTGGTGGTGGTGATGGTSGSAGNATGGSDATGGTGSSAGGQAGEGASGENSAGEPGSAGQNGESGATSDAGASGESGATSDAGAGGATSDAGSAGRAGRAGSGGRAGAGGAGAGGRPGTSPTRPDDGCGCRVVGKQRTAGDPFVLLLLAFGALVARRRSTPASMPRR